MTDRIYHSMVRTDYTIGDKLGLSAKFYGHDWERETLILPDRPSEVFEASKLHGAGHALPRERLPEAMCAWSPKHFARAKDLFMMGPFYAVKGKLADVMLDADLGDGSLVPIPIYEADKRTELPGPFYVLNWGAHKDTLVGPESNPKKVEFRYISPKTGLEVWETKFGVRDGDVAVHSCAATGADLWFDPKLRWDFFVSEGLADSLRREKIKTDFQLTECQLVEAGA